MRFLYCTLCVSLQSESEVDMVGLLQHGWGSMLTSFITLYHTKPPVRAHQKENQNWNIFTGKSGLRSQPLWIGSGFGNGFVGAPTSTSASSRPSATGWRQGLVMILDGRGGWATDISVKSRAAAAIEFRQHVLSEWWIWHVSDAVWFCTMRGLQLPIRVLTKPQIGWMHQLRMNCDQIPSGYLT